MKRQKVLQALQENGYEVYRDSDGIQWIICPDTGTSSQIVRGPTPKEEGMSVYDIRVYNLLKKQGRLQQYQEQRKQLTGS